MHILMLVDCRFVKQKELLIYLCTVITRVGCIYNHGDLSRTEAESILSSVDYNCFLVRQSSNAVGYVVYSYKDFGVFNHVKQEGTINRDFIHKTKRSVCLMPVHLDGKLFHITQNQLNLFCFYFILQFK